MAAHKFPKHLRNKNINYKHGRFFVTIQIAHNKSVLGAIVGETCVLNELGQGVERALAELPQKYPELALGEYVVMPNHIHAIFHITYRLGNKENHLGFLVGRFKGATAFLYGNMKRTGTVLDIGERLWQIDYWDDLITGEQELQNFEQYIRNNPKNWTRDRWGAVTTYMLGEPELLNMPKLAFVASQGYAASSLVPRRVWGDPPPPEAVVISTFTSAQEREVLRRTLSKRRGVIHVCPQGIPTETELSDEQRLALTENRLLFISPQAAGSRLNKKVATWCNEYVLRHAEEIWAGDLSPNGMLAPLLNNLHPGK